MCSADFLLSYFVFEISSRRRRFKGGGGELSTVLNPGTEEEEEEEEDRSSTQGGPPLVSIMNCGPGGLQQQGALHQTPRRHGRCDAADTSHVYHHEQTVDYYTERLYNSEVGCYTCNIT